METLMKNPYPATKENDQKTQEVWGVPAFLVYGMMSKRIEVRKIPGKGRGSGYLHEEGPPRG